MLYKFTQKFCWFDFSYVRDATAAMFIAFSLFVFPSRRPRIFAPDGSGELTIIISVEASPSLLAKAAFLWDARSGSGSMIQDHSDHGASKELVNPSPEWIHQFF